MAVQPTVERVVGEPDESYSVFDELDSLNLELITLRAQIEVQKQNQRLRTHCEVGGAALTLEQFEIFHPKITLGAE